MERFICPRCGEPFDEGGVYYVALSRLPFNLDGGVSSVFPENVPVEHYFVCEQCAATIREVIDNGSICR